MLDHTFAVRDARRGADRPHHAEPAGGPQRPEPGDARRAERRLPAGRGRRRGAWSSSAGPGRCSRPATTWARRSRSRSMPWAQAAPDPPSTVAPQGRREPHAAGVALLLQNTRRWRNLRKITIGQAHGDVYAAALMLLWATDLIVAADDTRFADVVAPGSMRGRVLRPPVGVRALQGEGAAADRRRHRRGRGPRASAWSSRSSRRRAGRSHRGVRLPDRPAAHDVGPAHQGGGQPVRRQHGLLQRPTPASRFTS